MPLHLQNRLLRVLEDGEFFSVGAEKPTKVDVRIIAATHQHLDHLISSAKFRIDLYHRLNVIRLYVSPLRERRSDIPQLLAFYVKQSCIELNLPRKTLRPETIEYLCSLDWPGNVRQLKNTCRWLSIMVMGDHIHLDDLPPELTVNDARSQNPGQDQSSDERWECLLRERIKTRLVEGDRDLANQIVDGVEKLMIEIAMDFTKGRRIQAADILGYGRNTLTRKLKRFSRRFGTPA